MRVEFSLLCTATVRGYSFNLVDLGIGTPISTMEQMLIAQLESTVEELERRSDMIIGRIYIGKTYIPRRRTPGGGFVPFECLNSNTWRMKGISDRWREHHRRDYGRDGLVVLCAITRETVPEGSPMSQEDLALAMEQKLLHHYLLSHLDLRVVNETFTAGHLAQHNYHAYAVYMAFRYADDGNTLPHEVEAQNEPSSPSPREADELEDDILLGPDGSPIDDSLLNDSILDSPHEVEAQNDQNDTHSSPRAADEIEEDVLLLGEGSLLNDSPTDGTTSQTTDPGPSCASPDKTPQDTITIESDSRHSSPIVVSDSDSDSDSALVSVPKRFRHPNPPPPTS